MKFIILLYIIIPILLILLLYRFIKNIYGQKDFFIILQIFLAGVCLNIFVLMYNLMYFSKEDTKPGPKGPKGITGDQGFMGELDECPHCTEMEKTTGDEKIEKDSKKVIVSDPIISNKIAGNHM